MTREERLELLKLIEKDIAFRLESTLLDDEKICAIHSVIEELEQEPCDDAISRQAAIDVVHEYFEKYLKLNDDICLDGIRSLPSVTPKQKMGRWIREKKHHKDDFQEFDYWDVRCSECGARKRIGWTNIRHCPMCGAKMAESEDTE